MNAAGHELVARVAWSQLTPAARSKVQELVDTSENPTTGVPTSERDNDVFNYTTYMDNIRPRLSDRHYVNNPLAGDGALPPGENSITLQQQVTDVLRDPTASKEQKAEALRLGGHLVGDIHVPLHNADNNDRGGNGFKLNGKANLHSFWDSAGGRWKNRLTREEMAAQAASLLSRFPSATYTIQSNQLDPATWSKQGWELAGAQVYKGVEPGRAPSEQYTASTGRTMDLQATLAGYRWASQLNSIFQP